MIPIKPGTARRMGIRRPPDVPAALIRLSFPPLPTWQQDALRAAFRADARKPPLLAPQPAEFTRRYLA